jgi:type III secretion protein R
VTIPRSACGGGRRSESGRLTPVRQARYSALIAALAVGYYARPATAAPVTDGSPLSSPLELILVLGVVAILPFAFMTLTAFVKISTVLQIVRGAIGAQNVPSNVIVMALAGSLTLLAMAPLGSRVLERSTPVLAGAAERATSVWVIELLQAVREPVRGFLKANASVRERGRFFDVARAAREPADRDSVGRDDLVVLVPAFVITELIEAFALGFALYLPFLVIDLVIANVLLALGMQMLNPTQVSLPFKLLLFVAVDGWGLLSEALVTGYRLGA